MLFYTQVAMVIVSTMASILGPVFWSLASFRPFETSPEIVQAFNDTGWIMFLVTWPPFSVWFIALAMCIFRDKRPEPEFPRWLAFFCLWAAVFLVPAGWVIFFKTGPFSWAGLFGLYIPVVVFLSLILSLTIPAIKAVNREMD